MLCKYQKDKCILSKNSCDCEDFNECKYYLRQNPIDEEKFSKSFVKALEKAVAKRDIYREIKTDEVSPNKSLSIFDNVKEVIEKIKPIKFEVKRRKEFDAKNFSKDSLKNLKNNLYDKYKLVLEQRLDSDNAILVFDSEAKSKMICYLNESLDIFLDNLKISKFKCNDFFSKVQKVKILKKKH